MTTGSLGIVGSFAGTQAAGLIPEGQGAGDRSGSDARYGRWIVRRFTRRRFTMLVDDTPPRQPAQATCPPPRHPRI